jgi:nitroreductase
MTKTWPVGRVFLDTFDGIKTRLDVRQYAARSVPPEVKLKVLEAGRATGSGMNRQHWRFLLIQDKEAIKKLAEDSTSGKWASGADFAVVILTDPTLGFHLIDAGRALQDMQLAAWNHGVASGIYTGVKEESMRKDFGIPKELKPTAVVTFGYPPKKIVGKKNRLPLAELAYLDKFGNKFDPKKLV